MLTFQALLAAAGPKHFHPFLYLTTNFCESNFPSVRFPGLLAEGGAPESKLLCDHADSLSGPAHFRLEAVDLPMREAPIFDAWLPITLRPWAVPGRVL